MVHLTNTLRSATFLLGTAMLMLFFFCAPMHAQTPTFKSTSSYKIANPSNSAQQLDPTTIGHQAYRSTIYTPFGSSTPSSNNPSGNSGSGGSGDPDDDVGIPGWADTPSEPLPIGDGMGILLLMATMMVGAIFLKQRKQLSESISKSTTSTTNINNLRGNQLPTALKKENTITHMTTRKQTYQSFFQKLFLLLAFVCIAGQVSADKTIYFRPGTRDFSIGYQTKAQAQKRAETANEAVNNSLGTYDNVHWIKNSRIAYKVTGHSSKADIESKAHQTIVRDSVQSGKQSRFLPITIPTGYTGVKIYRTSSSTYTTFNDWSWVHKESSIHKSNTIPVWSNSTTHEPSSSLSVDRADGKNLICNREGWWDEYYWAYYLPKNSGVKVYFADINGWDNAEKTNSIQMLTGKDIYTFPTAKLVNIKNTKLYYLELTKEYGYEYYGFILNSTAWSEAGNIPAISSPFIDAANTIKGYIDDSSITQSAWNKGSSTNSNLNTYNNRIANRIKKATKRTGLREDLLSGANLFIPGAANDAAVSKQTLGSWQNLNHTQTITVKGGGKINYNTFKLISANSTGDAVHATNKTGTVTFNAAYTATVIVRAIPDNGYDFIGFFEEGSNTSLSYTEDSENPGEYLLYYEAPNADKKITAVFSDSKAIRMQLLNDDLQWKSWDATPNGNTLKVAYTDIITNTAVTYTFDKPRTENTWVYNNKEYIYINNIDASKNITFTADASQSEYTFIGWWNNNIAYSTNPWSLDNPANYNQSVTARFARVKQQTVNVHTYNTTNDTYDALGTVGGNVSITYTKSAIDGVLNKDNDANGYSNGYKEFTNNVATSGTYASIYNSSVTLTATPNTNYAFLGWYEGENKVSSNTTYTYPATTERNITARFHKPFTQAFDVQTEIGGQYQNSTTGGTAKISYNDGTITKDIGSSTLSITDMYQGSMNTLTATPNDGYRFVGWYNGSGALDSSNPTYTYRAEGSRTVHARFARNDVQLVVAVMNYNTDYAEFVEYPHDNNTVTIANGGNTTTVTSSTSAIVNYGSQVTLTATHDDHETEGYHFIGWYQNNQRISTNPTYTFTITDHSAISAHFAPIQCHKVIVKASVGGIYTVKYAREDWFNTEGMYYTATSQYEKDVEIHVPYEAKIAVLNPQPIIGYSYLGYKVTKGIKDNDTYTIDVNKYDKNDPPMVAANLVRTDEQVIYLDISNKDKADSKWNEKTQFGCNLRTSFATENNCTPQTATFEQVTNTLYKLTIQANVFESITIVDAINNNLVTVSSLPLAIPSTRYNCFKLNAYQSSTGEWVDAWTTVPTQTGDYRLIYREQTVVNKNEIHIDYEFNEGDRIKKITSDTKTDIVNLHIYNKVSSDGINGINNPEVILQQWDGTNWVDVERYMVFGPLRSDKPGVIKMPNRKNTAGEVIQVNLGIDAIIEAADEEDQACGVWNFYIKQENGTAKLEVGKTEKYTGNYYIRTTNADGQYHRYTIPANVMQYSEYAKKNSDYSHYFIRYVDINEDGTPTSEAGKHNQVKFTVATDYAIFLCKELMINNNRFTSGICKDNYEDDIFVINSDNNPILPVDATVRWGWDCKTNRLTRAYIADTEFKNNEYLVVEGSNIGSPSGEATYFNDNSNYLYSIDLNATKNATAKVKAKMNGKYQYFMGTNAAGEQLISGNGANTYPIRLLYDFKDDRFTTIYRPKAALSGTVNLETPVMIEREHNDAPTQIQFNSQAKITVEDGNFDQPAYAVMTFLEDKLLDNDVSKYEKMFYWISFPFDVKISDVFGLGEYGKYWIMEEYDGAQRAQSGLAQTNWKYITKKSHVLQQNVGYVLCLNYSQILQDQLFKSHGSGEFSHSKLSLYFPSNSVISPAMLKGGQSVTRTLERMENNATAWNHHNWHLIGVPSFATPGFDSKQDDIPFLYQYWHPDDAYAAVTPNDVTFHAMHSFMVQYYGDITWTSVVNTGTPLSIAAKKDADADKKIMLRLELQQAGSTLDKTYVQLRNDKGTKGFDMSLDLTKIINAGANIYSIVDNHEMAGNAIPKDETVLPLGVVITAAGEYTIAMPNGTEGMIVELIDYEQGTSTNLLMSDYTITLDKGTFNQRFALRLKPDKVATSVDNIGNGANGDEVRKLLIDGVLYLQQGTNTYDAQGKHVQ